MGLEEIRRIAETVGERRGWDFGRVRDARAPVPWDYLEVVRRYFLDLESLIFWLKAVPLPEEFDPEKHWQQVYRLVDECSTPRGIRTNEHRELLIGKKAEG